MPCITTIPIVTALFNKMKEYRVSTNALFNIFITLAAECGALIILSIIYVVTRMMVEVTIDHVIVV